MQPPAENSGAILNKDPHHWSESEVALLCESFIHYCDREKVSMDWRLITRLWRYWFLIHDDDQPLMADPKYNIALMLNAGALGEFVPLPGDGDFFARYRRDHAEFEEALAPAQLSWGPRATMKPVSGPTLDSAVAHVCVSRSGGLIHEILVAGQGLPELRQEILQVTLSCMLGVQAGDLDMLNVDALRIVAPVGKQDLFELPGLSTLGNAATLAPRDERTAADALSEVVQKFRLLQEQTEMVAVHECDALEKQNFDVSLRNYAKDAHEKENVTIVAKDAPAMAGVITFAPYYQIARRPSPFRIGLDAPIIQLPSFEQLLEAFTYHTVERASAAAKVRQETYQQRAVDLRMEQERWRNASEFARKEMWPESQLLSERFNYETGTIVRLAEPKAVTTSDYMEKNLPSLIEQFENWAKQMQKIVSDISEATYRSDTPIRRLAASRFLDAALRDRGHLIDDATTRRCFDRWSAAVAPLLRYKWRTALQKSGIETGIVFARNTVFHTRFQVDDSHNVIGLVMQPLAMVSPIDSLILFDRGRPTLVVRNAHDHARAFNTAACPAADKLWEDLKATAIQENRANPEAFSERVRFVLSQAPFELLPKIIEIIQPAENDRVNSELELDQLRRKRAELLEMIRLVGLPSKVSTMVSHGAIHSARRLILEAKIPGILQTRLLLWAVLVECFAHGHDPTEYLPGLTRDQWRRSSLDFNDGFHDIARLLREAETADRGFVQQWIDRLCTADGLQQAVNLLRQDWIRLEDQLSTPEDQISYDFLRSIESMALAKQLAKAATEINPGGESPATLLTKVGQSLEDLLLTDLGATPFSDVIALLEILVGSQIPSN